jgi:hypothetical protein
MSFVLSVGDVKVGVIWRILATILAPKQAVSFAFWQFCETVKRCVGLSTDWQCAVRGASTRQIAKQLGVEVGTVTRTLRLDLTALDH